MSAVRSKIETVCGHVLDYSALFSSPKSQVVYFSIIYFTLQPQCSRVQGSNYNNLVNTTPVVPQEKCSLKKNQHFVIYFYALKHSNKLIGIF